MVWRHCQKSLFRLQRELGTSYLEGNRATASVTWVEGVAINFLPAISEASCGPAPEQDLVPMAYVPPPREGFVVPNSFLVRNAHLNFYLQSSLYNREADSRTAINDFH